MNIITNKITYFFIKNDKPILAIIVIMMIAFYFSVTHSKKSTTNFKCSNSICTIKKLNNKGIVKSIHTIPTNYCKSFYVARRLSVPESIVGYLLLTDSARRSHFGREKGRTYLYTVGCINSNGHKFPLFETYIHDQARTQTNVDTLNVYITTESPTFDMSFDEKETVFK